jgi:hypothetical protein
MPCCTQTASKKKAIGVTSPLTSRTPVCILHFLAPVRLCLFSRTSNSPSSSVLYCSCAHGLHPAGLPLSSTCRKRLGLQRQSWKLLVSPLCSLLYALCSLLYALCSLLSAFCSLLSARCSLLSALCSPILSASPAHAYSHTSPFLHPRGRVFGRSRLLIFRRCRGEHTQTRANHHTKARGEIVANR